MVEISKHFVDYYFIIVCVCVCVGTHAMVQVVRRQLSGMRTLPCGPGDRTQFSRLSRGKCLYLLSHLIDLRLATLFLLLYLSFFLLRVEGRIK